MPPPKLCLMLRLAVGASLYQWLRLFQVALGVINSTLTEGEAALPN
jgi:hypothetical protein